MADAGHLRWIASALLLREQWEKARACCLAQDLKAVF